MTYSGATHRSAPAGVSATIQVVEPVSAGTGVFRVRNAALSAAAGRTIADASGIPFDSARRHGANGLGEPLEVMVVIRMVGLVPG